MPNKRHSIINVFVFIFELFWLVLNLNTKFDHKL